MPTEPQWSVAERATVAVFLGVLALAVYMGNGRYISAPDTTPNELLPISLLERGDLHFDEFATKRESLPYFYVMKNDRVISFYPIVPGLLNVPAHAIARAAEADVYELRYALAKLTASTVVAFSVSFLFLALIQVCKRPVTAAVIALIYAFCTHAWSVASQGLWQHGPSLLFLSLALWLLMAPHRRWLPLVGLFLGLAVFNRPSNLMFALPVTLYMAKHERRRLPLFLAFAAIPAFVMALYSQTYWGSLLALGQGHRLEGRHGPHHTYFLASLLPGLAGVLFSPNRGLLVFSPIFLVATPFWLSALWRRGPNPLWGYLAVGAFLHLLLYASWSVWWGGWSFGYRLLIEMLPVLILFLAIAWECWASLRVWRQSLFWALAAASLYVQILGAYAYPSDWNAAMDVDANPGICWSLADTELGRCQAIVMRNLGWRERSEVRSPR